MSRHHHITLTVLGVIALSIAAISSRAYAYALPGTATMTTPAYTTSSFYLGGWNGDSWQNLGAPFQNFTQSLQSLNGADFDIAISTNTVPNFSNTATETAHNAFVEFDNWLASVIGFHISQIFVVLLQLMSWALGITKNFIDWLLSWVH